MKKTAKTILITGTSTGIGRETALRLAKAGHRVFAGVRRKIDKDELEKLNPNIKGVYLDITNPSSIDKAFWFIIKNTDKIDVLINNAGIAVAGPVELLPVKKIKEQFDVNVFGTLNVTQKFFPILNGGLIINISSLASTGIFPYIAPYCASKRALDILFNCLMLENKDNIKVVSVKPAVIKTPIWDKSIKKAQDVFSEFNEASRKKYDKELNYMAVHSEKNNTRGLEPYCVVSVIEKIINSKNPKPSYNVGFISSLADFVSRLPQEIINEIIKLKLNKIK